MEDAEIIAEAILSLFIGREGLVSVAKGDAFNPQALELTPELLAREHLEQKRCLGFYLMHADNRVRCSCVDFDNKPDRPDPLYRNKAEKVAYFLRQIGLSVLVELSQSGQAAHVWMFFEAPVEAWIVRAFWRRLLERLEIPPCEIYPRQDRLKDEGAIGNMVRYPLWSKSAFVDIDNDWSALPPLDALAGAKPFDGEDLAVIAFHNNLGKLSPDQSAKMVEVVGGVLPARVAKLVDGSSSLLAKRWNGDTTGMADKSRSALAMAVCCELVRSYVPTLEVEAALRVWLKRHDPDGKYDRQSWIDGTVLKAYDFVTNRREEKSLSATTFHSAVHQYIDRIEKGESFFVPFGIPELDASIDGVGPGEVAIVAGRPNHGKSAVGFQALAHASTLGVHGLCISEEMSAVEIGKRRLMSITDVPQEHWVPAVCSRLRKDTDTWHKDRGDVFVVESCQTIDRVDAIIDQYVQFYKVGIVMVDYMQLLSARGEGRYEVVTEVSKRLKQAARRNNVAIIGMCQLNRQVEGRDDNEPKMSDLKESGGLEQDADLIVMCQYPKRFRADAPDDEYRLIIQKRRNGPIRQARIITKFNPEKQMIGEFPLPAHILDL